MFFARSFFQGSKVSTFFTVKNCIFTTLLCTLSPYSFAGALNTLSDVKQELDKGRRINLTLDLTQCVNPDTGVKGTVKGGLVIDSYLIRPDGSLAFSDTHQTVNKEEKPVVQILRYRSKDEHTISFSMRLFSLPDWQPSGKGAQYDCRIGQGMVFYSHD